MTLTIELTHEEETRLRVAAQAKGKTVAELAHALLTRNLPGAALTEAQSLAFWRSDSPKDAQPVRQEAEMQERDAPA